MTPSYFHLFYQTTATEKTNRQFFMLSKHVLIERTHSISFPGLWVNTSGASVPHQIPANPIILHPFLWDNER